MSGRDGYARPGVAGGEPPSIREPRCEECNRLLARLVTRPWRIECSRCGYANGRPRPEEGGAEAKR